MKFTVCDSITGEVRYSGEGDSPESLAQAGESVILGVSYSGGWVDSNGTHNELGQPPSASHTFDWLEKHWVDKRVLSEVKLAKNQDINASRLRANQATFTFNGKKIAADALSRSDIDATHGIVLLTNEMPDGWVGGWKTVDNSYVSIPDVATWVLFYKAMVAQGSINFAHSQALKARLAAATTIEEVEAIVW